MNQKDSKRLLFLGFILIVIGVVDFVYTLSFEPIYVLFWFSNTITIFLGLSLILRNRMLMGAMLISSFVEVPWIIDFISQIFFGVGFFGNVTQYMFRDFGPRSINFYMELDHLLIIPIAIYAAYKIGIHKNSFLISSTHAIVLNSLTFYFTPSSQNINCIFHLCSFKKDILNINDIAYLVIWTGFLCLLAYVINRIATKFFKSQNHDT